TTIAAANPGSDLATVITALVTLPTVDALTDALLQIAPASGFVGISQESFNTTRQFQKVWLENLYRFREHCCMDDCCNLVERVCCDPCGKNPTDAKSSPMCRKCIDCEGPRIWATGFGSHSHQNPRDFLNGYKANTYGGTIAFDAPLVCGLRAGVGAGYAFTDLDESRFDNATDINNYEGTFYLSYTSYSWFVNTGFSFGWDQFYGTRNINYTGVSRTAHAKYNGQEYTGFFATGYQKYFNCFEFTPFATVIATYQHIGDFTETGADSLNLHINEQNYTYVESGLGLQIAYLFRTCHGVYVPEVHSIWLHDFYQNRLNVDAIFTGLGAGAGSFPNTGPGIGRNTWDIGGSITFMISRTFSIMVNYDYNRSKAYYSHQGLLELSYSF
ncbi:MAG TPA: autotransporter outer membrane beta-barrel domain-containing protein, partial [Patescibacteria group bacterium]|nr:autotransporter outer membrane beta-barrel domain-containing protein [Patescibacteria group bacterium]